MSLSILNNIPSLEAQNQLATTNTNLQNTLFQLSSGSKINSGADDPAGLSIADGLQANISALTQSAQNVTDGVGMLQTADGALSQVTTLLNRAVTLATEAANTGLTQDQQNALQNEFTSITAEIDQIGSNTTYNNTPVFTGSAMSVFLSDGSGADAEDPNISVNMPTLSASALGLASYSTGTLDLTANPAAGNTVTIGSQTYTFVSAPVTAANQVEIGTNNGSPNIQQTLLNLQAAVNGGAGAGTAYGAGTAINQQATITAVNGGSAVVQALQAGAAGNDVTLSANLVSNSGGQVSGAFLTGGTNTTADAGTLTLNANPGYLSTATGSVTLSEQPDTIANATGIFSLLNSSGVATLPTIGNATQTVNFGVGNLASLAGMQVVVGGQTYKFVNAAPAAANQIDVAAGGITTVTQALTDLQDMVNGTAVQYGVSGTDYDATQHAATGVVLSSFNVGTGVATFAASATGAAGDTLTVNASGGATASSNLVSGSNVDFAGGGTSDNVTIGGQTYTFVAASAALNAQDIAVGASGVTATDVQTTLTNLMNAVNGVGTGTVNTYGTGTTAAGTATMALSATNGEAILTATTAGVGNGTTTGNSVAFTASITGLADAANPTGTPGYLSGGAPADTVTIGGTTYTFVAAGQAVGANQVAEGSNAQGTLTNLMDAVNGIASAQSNNTYGVGTNANANALITSINTTTNTATIEAASGGDAYSGVGNGSTTGNSVALAASSPVGAISVSGANLTGGANTDTVTIGDVTYSFVAPGQATSGNEVAVGQTVQATLANLKAAVNAAATGAGANGTYYVTNLQGAAGASMSVSGTTATITANTTGILTNGIALSGDFGAGNATATFGGTTNAFLGGGTATDAATGLIQLAAQPTAGNATGTVTLGSSPAALVGHSVTIAGTAYNFVAAGGANAAGDVAIGATMAATLANFQNAVNGTGTTGVNTYDPANANQTSAVVSSFNASTGVVNIAATSQVPATGDAVTLASTVGSVSAGTLAGGAASDTLILGAQTYTFVAANAATAGNEVALGSNLQATLANLQAAVNSTNISNGNAATYHLAAAGNLQGAGGASITSIYDGQALVTANTAGTAGNALALSGTGSISSDVFGTPGGTVAANAASGYLALNALPVAGNTATIGSQTYTFTNSTPAAANQVAIGGSIANALANLKAAVNGLAGAGTAYGTGTVANTLAQIGAITGDQAAVTAVTAGAGTQGAGTGNYIAVSVSLGTASAGGAVSTPTTLTGGSSTQAAAGTLDLVNNLTQGNTITVGSQAYTFVNTTPIAANQVLIGGSANATLQNLQAALSLGPGSGSLYGAGTSANNEATITNVSGNQATVTATSVGTIGNSYAVLVGNTLGGGGSSVDLSTTMDAQTALTTIAAAIASVAAQRGAIGSGINQMNAAVDVMNNTSQNLTSSLSGIQDANIGQVVANMSKYQVLEQTGIAALAQANSQEQAVLKLLQ
jgi:flagellin